MTISPHIQADLSNLIVNKTIENNYNTKKESMLFSGGVDAYTTYFRHQSNNLDLITIWGADVELKDLIQWKRVVFLNNNEPLLSNNNKYIIKSNMRDFYTINVNFLHKDLGWWGSVQHGLGLNSLIAPLSYLNGYSSSYIASSYTKDFGHAWGSTPEIDNNIKWANTQVIHDGFELKRQDKVKLIVQNIKKSENNIQLRVCYSEINQNTNCSKCEKCHRTIMGIILENDNPNNYGFNINNTIYEEIINSYKDGFGSEGSKYFWWEILERIKENNSFFVFQNKLIETKKVNRLKTILELNMTKKPPNKSNINKVKYYLRNKFPNLFKTYSNLKKVLKK